MLNTAIDTLTLAEKLVSSIPIAKDVFASVIVILTTIKVSIPLVFRRPTVGLNGPRT